MGYQELKHELQGLDSVRLTNILDNSYEKMNSLELSEAYQDDIEANERLERDYPALTDLAERIGELYIKANEDEDDEENSTIAAAMTEGAKIAAFVLQAAIDNDEFSRLMDLKHETET